MNTHPSRLVPIEVDAATFFGLPDGAVFPRGRQKARIVAHQIKVEARRQVKLRTGAIVNAPCCRFVLACELR